MRPSSWRVHLFALAVVSFGLLGTAAVSHATEFPFQDSVEDTAATYWTAEPPWGTTTLLARSAVRSWTDSPGTFYENGVDVTLTLSDSIDLQGSVAPQLAFWHQYQLEAGFDFGHVELSTDDGTTWPILLGSYSGTETDPFVAGTAAIVKKSEEDSDRTLLSPGQPARWARSSESPYEA